MIAPRDAVRETAASEHGGRLALDAAVAGARVVCHDFSVCLNAFGPAASVRLAIARCDIEEYPDPASRGARRAASDAWCRPMSEIVFGAGAAELIHAACSAYVRPGDEILVMGPAFGEYARAAALCGGRVRTIVVNDEIHAPFANAIAAIERMQPRLVFAATPMNPTGRAFAVDEIRRIADACEHADCLLVLDQAYDGFAAHPLGTPALPGHTHVLHLRSLTKDHALAGIRAAFGVGPASVIENIERVRVPWAASSIAQAAAIAAMGDDAAVHVAMTTESLRGEAARIRRDLAASDYTVEAGAAHYFLIRCDAASIRDRLLADAGILVRDCTSFGIPDAIRIAARTPDENNPLIAALLAPTTHRV